ncbi:MAG TPA: undecaprenyl-diphosphatase UppP [Melioribacteraceae bacterium]|nr:undecaprenyl-diphosphatase UppP [Melioribacteraceae bacterium]
MNIIEAIVLGIIQGLTEFLPISSTGHLTLVGKFMGLISDQNPEKWTAFIAVIQLGTLAAVLIYFYKDLYNIFIEFIKYNLISPKKLSRQSTNSKLGWFIILGSIPVVIIGLGFKDFIEGHFTKNLYVIATSLIVLGIILAGAEKFGKFTRGIEKITWLDALLIGCAQALSLIPGSSRSGTTITAGLFLGLNRETAARFSFLLSIPAVLGSGLLEFYHEYKNLDQSGFITLAIATLASALSGYFAIAFLINFLKKNTTYVFVIYRVGIGVAILLFLYFNIINP